MLLNKDEIEDRKLITEGFEKEALRTAGYDLRIRTMIVKQDGKAETFTDDCDLPRQGIVAVVSEEIVKLPADVCAFASVKTGLCREGIIAINIGLIDPGWEGPISSVMLNFGKDTYRLRKGETFLRLTFHKVSPPLNYQMQKPQDRQKYESDIRTKFDKRLAATYMDVDKMAAEASKKYLEDIRSATLKYFPAIALVLALITFFLNFALLNTVSRTMPFDAVQMVRAQASSDAAKKEADDLQSENRDLHRQIDELRVAMQKLVPTSTGGAKTTTVGAKSK